MTKNEKILHSYTLISSEQAAGENLKPDNGQTINSPELSDPNWVKVGKVDELYIYPVKSGGKLRTDNVRCNRNGMITTSNNCVVWDGLV